MAYSAVETRLGSRVLLVGDCEELGNWDPEFAQELLTTREQYPIWKAEVRLPQNSVLSYKYIVDLGDQYVWESMTENRKIELFSPVIVLEDEQGNKHTTVTITQSSQHLYNKQLSSAECTAEPHVFDHSIKFSKENRVIIASMYLPIKVSRNSEGGWSFKKDIGSWMYPMYEIAMSKHINFIWIGWPWIQLENEDETEELTRILSERYNWFPIFIPEPILRKHLQFCRSILFPLFHNIVDSDLQYSPKLMEKYRDVNSRFSDEIIRHHQSTSDVVWIHDYQLWMWPVFISKRSKQEPMNIGLAFHIPFPTSEVFRMFPDRDKFLNAILNWDLIGFHLFEYCRNFTNTCNRLLGVNPEWVEGGFLGINYCGRFIMLRVGYIGIEPNIIEKTMKDEKFRTQQLIMSERYKHKKVILGIDRSHPLSGINLKLNAFRKFLYDNPSYANKVVLIQVLLESRHNTQEIIQDMATNTHALAEEINSENGCEVVQIIVGEINSHVRYAYLSSADAFCMTQVREGLSLEAMEYILWRKDKPGQLLISEFGGVSRELTSAWLLNPFDISSICNYLQKIIYEDRPQVTPQQARDLAFVREKTVEQWAFHFLSDIMRSKKDTTKFQYFPIGLSDKVKIIGLPMDFQRLQPEIIMEKYHSSENRLLVFDNEGTLIKRRSAADLDAPIDPDVVRVLHELSRDPKNTVVIITGRMQAILDRWYGSLKNWVLCSEYGYLLRWKGEEIWEKAVYTECWWKDMTRTTMKQYAVRTQGAVIEEKEISLAFQYRAADQQYGKLQAKELVTHLKVLLTEYLTECQIRQGMGYVEVGLRNIHKGATLCSLVDRIYKEKDKIDFIMTVGDDLSDEKMFEAVNSISEPGIWDGIEYNTFKAYTCVVEMKPSKARYYLHDTDAVKQLMKSLIKKTVTCRAPLSLSDQQLLGVEPTRHRRRASRIDIHKANLLEDSDPNSPLFPFKSTTTDL